MIEPDVLFESCPSAGIEDVFCCASLESTATLDGEHRTGLRPQKIAGPHSLLKKGAVQHALREVWRPRGVSCVQSKECPGLKSRAWG